MLTEKGSSYKLWRFKEKHFCQKKEKANVFLNLKINFYCENTKHNFIDLLVNKSFLSKVLL